MWQVRALAPEDATNICTWRYPAPFDLYDATSISGFLEPENHYYAVDYEGALAGFFCLGQDAQVPGGVYTEPGTDIGLGLRPDLTGQGLGPTFLEAILEATRGLATDEPRRLTVAAFNMRARRLYEKRGFRVERSFTAYSGLEFIQMTLVEPV